MAQTNIEERYWQNVQAFGPRIAFMIDEHRPLRCRLGWHAWRHDRVERLTVGGNVVYLRAAMRPSLSIDICARCGAERYSLPQARADRSTPS